MNAQQHQSFYFGKKINILGFQIDKLIRTKIYEADFLAADITKQNQNVFYEIGYALACGKPVLPTIHAAIANARENVQRLGLFDTTGYADYNNAEELCYHLQRWEKNFMEKYAADKAQFCPAALCVRLLHQD